MGHPRLPVSVRLVEKKPLRSSYGKLRHLAADLDSIDIAPSAPTYRSGTAPSTSRRGERRQLLIDTQAVLWRVRSNPRLSSTAKSAMEDEREDGNQLLVSAH